MGFMPTMSLKLVFQNAQIFLKNIMETQKLKNVNFNVLNFFMGIQLQISVVNQLIVKLDSLQMIFQINVSEFVPQLKKRMDSQ